MRTSVDAPMTDPIIDRSTKSLDKWRFMFHIFNMTTFTVAVISLGVSLTTYTAAPPAPSNVKEYAVPVIYYGLNGAAMTMHASFGALSCVKGNLLFLKVYTAIGYVLVIEEVGMGSWMVSTLQDRIDAVIKKITELEDAHHDENEEGDAHHDEEEEESNSTVSRRDTSSKQSSNSLYSYLQTLLLNPVRDKREADEEGEHHDEEEEEEATIHTIYNSINVYYQCCMYAAEWIEEARAFEEIYNHCLTEGDYFCGKKFILFPGKDIINAVKENCSCEGKVKSVMTDRIVRQTILLFIALPSQILCLVCVAFFMKFEITVNNNIVNSTVGLNPCADSSSKFNMYSSVELTSPEL